MRYQLLFLPAIITKGEESQAPDDGSGQEVQFVDDNGDPLTGPTDENYDYFNGGFRRTPAIAANLVPKNRDDFLVDEVINHSDKMHNARFSVVDNHDTGTEIQVNTGGWGNGFNSQGYAAEGAINGVKRGGQQIFSHNAHHGQDNWFADITGNPTISFIKLWPGDWIGGWCRYFTYRVFINDVECFPIEDYQDDYANQLLRESKPAIWSCPNAVFNANQVRVASSTYISFNEIEIFESDECPVKDNETCTQAEIDNSHGCRRLTCGEPVPGYQICENRQCSCLRNGVTPITYDIPKCNCPPGRTGDRCQNYLPCESESPCQHGGVCRNIISANSVDYRCYCVGGRTGKNCQIPPPCNGPSCHGSGDVHYTPFDGTYYDNMGFCQYVITTNGGCSTENCSNSNLGCSNWPLLATNFDFVANDPNQDFFMVIGTQTHTGSHNNRISRLTGLQIYWRPRSNNVLYRITTHNDYNGWITEQQTAPINSNNPFSPLLATNILNNFNFPNKNLAMRVNGNNNVIYLGAGTVYETDSWHASASASCNDYLMKITYNKAFYGYIRADTNCELRGKVCGICGNYDGVVDFDRTGSRVDYERALERKHYWEMSWDSSTTAGSTEQCPYTDIDGNAVPLLSMAHNPPTSTHGDDPNAEPCGGAANRAAVEAECNKLNLPAFSSCSLDRQTRINECIFDACAIPNDVEKFICDALQGYVDACNNAGASNRISSWRTTDLCPMPCPVNAHYESCTSFSCWPTVTSCEVDSDECNTSTECVEGCFCDTNYILDGDTCVLDDGNQCKEEEQRRALRTADAAIPCGAAPCKNGGECQHVFTGAVATGYTCNCKEGFIGSECQTKLTIDNTFELVGQLLPPNSNVQPEDFLSHGCFCSRLDGQSNFHGRCVSDVDRVCRRLAHCNTCAVNALCGSETGYPFITRMGADGPECDAEKNTPCQQAQCACSMATAKDLVEAVADGSEVPYKNCVEKTNQERAFDCCGANDKWMVYPSDEQCDCTVDEFGIPSVTYTQTYEVKEF